MRRPRLWLYALGCLVVLLLSLSYFLRPATDSAAVAHGAVVDAAKALPPALGSAASASPVPAVDPASTIARGTPPPTTPSHDVLAPATNFTDDGWETITFGGRTDLWEGEPVVARIQTPSRKLQLVPNQNGEFPRVFVPENTTVAVSVTYPRGRLGDQVAVAPLDGGAFADGTLNKVLTLTADGRLAFDFTVSWQAGLHRVLLQRPGQLPVAVDLWVGPDLTYDLVRR